MSKLIPWKLVMAALILSGCTRSCGGGHKDMTPEQVVEGYLDVAFNMTDVNQRSFLLEYTTGKMRAAIESVSDETIKTAYIDRKYKIQSYSVVERRDRTPRETEVTFRLEYQDLGADKSLTSDSAPKVTTENTVSVVREKGYWLIRDVLGNKTAIDFPVAPESRIEAKPGVLSGDNPDNPNATVAPESPSAP